MRQKISHIATLLTEAPDIFREWDPSPYRLDPRDPHLAHKNVPEPDPNQDPGICVSCDEEISPKDIGKYDGLCYTCANTSESGHPYYADQDMAHPGPVQFIGRGHRGDSRGPSTDRSYHGPFAEAIARNLTEDPDIFLEFDAAMDQPLGEPPDLGIDQDLVEPDDKPLDEMDIEREADEIAGDDSGDADRQVARDLKHEQDAAQADEMQRREMLQPQFDQVDSSLGDLQAGVAKGTAMANDAGKSFGGLDKAMQQLKTLIAGLQKMS
jgi:hypothetical protein